MNNYRPISVLPSLSKLFEKIVYAQIYEYLPVTLASLCFEGKFPVQRLKLKMWVSDS
jgi:hypothetical protein